MTDILHSQMLNATFWLVPNARLLQTACAWCDMHATPHIQGVVGVIRHGRVHASQQADKVTQGDAKPQVLGLD
jgi:hypothetical protein